MLPGSDDDASTVERVTITEEEEDADVVETMEEFVDEEIVEEDDMTDDDILAEVDAAAAHISPMTVPEVALSRKQRNAACQPAPKTMPKPVPVVNFAPSHQKRGPRKSTQVLKNMTGGMKTLTSQLLTEGSRQYRESIRDTSSLGAEFYSGSRSMLRHFASFLLQPVWVPGKRAIPVQRSRGMLFVIDIVRFGGTFAGIFAALFLVLNYQSFWEIARARMEPLNQANLAVADPVGEELEKILTEGGDPASADAAPQVNTNTNNLFSYVPPVGPPQPQLIVPKLGLNVPIVIPSDDPLINQDWKGLEEEIQTALQDGVVHYPGTAQPGQGGNFFLTGHSSYYPWAPGKYKSVFARLGDLEVGDEYWVYYKGDKHRFVVDSKKEVRPSDVTVLDQPTDRRMGTLMTCWPVGTTLRRMIVTSTEVDPLTGSVLGVGQHGTQDILPQVKVEVLPI